MPPSQHGPSTISSPLFSQQNCSQSVSKADYLECFTSCSGFRGGRLNSHSSDASREDGNSKVSLASSVVELMNSIPDEEGLEEVKVVAQDHLKASEEGDGKEEVLRPPSPFVVLGYGERGGDLTTNGVADVSIVDLETELANLRKKLMKLRGEEEKRRQQLYEVWKQKNPKVTRGISSPLCTSRGRKNRNRKAASTVDEMTGVKLNGSDVASSVMCNTNAICKGILTPPAKDEGAHDGEKGTGNTAALDQPFYGHNNDNIFLFNGRRPRATRNGMFADSADPRVNCSGLLNDGGSSASRTNLPNLDDFPKAGKGWLGGRRGRKSNFTVVAAADDHGNDDAPNGDNQGGEETPLPCVDKKNGVNGWKSHEGEVDLSYYSISLVQTGSAGMLEFVFDEDDAAKRRAFRDAENKLMLAEQRILLQMETLLHGRPQAGRHYWQSNESVTHCTRCGKLFSITVRKHHCRRCGILLCNDCCSQVGRDMYALQHDRASEQEEDEEEDVVVVDDNGEIQATVAVESTNNQKKEYDWMFDTYELTDGTNWRQEEGDEDKLFSQRSKVAASHTTRGSGRGRGGLKVRSAPWCRICNCCYLICLRARIERNYSDVLSDGRRRFHVLRDDEQAFTNLNMAWEARVAQLDVLKHLIVERATSAAQGQMGHFAGLFKEWMRSLGRRTELNHIEGNSDRSNCGSESQ
ncbi:hypothetical protein MOQ_004712 [Trypanosoma cruzi marinkellei]|uniref:FYVE-type domain-containing protein n=1 Tax=Trypanosoma cruzi marinkellei TaxID=85056 RepID=K2M8S9_TRYCR|nr:hypothetical protein MOQ_004712 [Trypanosoma cruzi marinkellei]